MNNKMGDSSYLKLKWNIQGIFDKFLEIERELEHRINQLPENNIKERKRITNWINQIQKIDHSIQNVIKYKLGELEKT